MRPINVNMGLQAGFWQRLLFMRVLVAGIFVYVLVVFSTVIGGYFIAPSIPPWLNAFGVIAVFLIAVVLAHLIFNKPGASILGLQSKDDYIAKLESKNLLRHDEYKAKRAFQVTELEDEGLSYYIELDDDSVLYLSGQYLYYYELTDKDSDEACSGQFPCDDFIVKTHKEKGGVVDIVCKGRVLDLEIIVPPLSLEDFRREFVPEDGQIIRDQSYDQIKMTLLTRSH